MIKSFSHKGLKQFYETGSTRSTRRIQADHAKKIRMQLAALDTAQSVDDLDIPGYRLHALKGTRMGIGSITVKGNWRITFEFSEGNAHIVNYEDYH